MSSVESSAPEVLLCDTSFVVQVTRAEKRPEIIDHWPAGVHRRLAQAQLAISVITIAEVRSGLVGLSDKTRHEAESRLATYTPVPLDMEVVDEWAWMMHRCKQDGQGEPKHNDVWIAATAKARDLPLVSCDLPQCRLPGLDVIYLKRAPESGDLE